MCNLVNQHTFAFRRVRASPGSYYLNSADRVLHNQHSGDTFDTMQVVFVTPRGFAHLHENPNIICDGPWKLENLVAKRREPLPIQPSLSGPEVQQ